MKLDLPSFFVPHRLEKRRSALGAGIDPYPYSFHITHRIQELERDFAQLVSSEAKIACAGRVLAVRNMGRATFIDIIDAGITFQAYLRGEAGKKTPVLTLLDIGDWIGLEGQLFTTKTGQQTIQIQRIVILGKAVADVPLGKVHNGTVSYGLADLEVRRQERYLDWITNPASMERFKLRSRIISLTRSFLETDGFLEVLTPTLEPIYGGAEARPFSTDVWALKRKMYLRVSPELYLKRYIIGGFQKVFTICQNFRNEGIDATHNPEFTMMEWYEAFTDYEDQMERFERLTCHLVESIHGKLKIPYGDREVDFTPPWPRLRIPALVEEVFGRSIDQIDKTALEEKICAEASKKYLIEKGLTLDEFRSELKAASLGQLVMEEIESDLHRRNRLWNPCFLCDHPKDISPLTKVKRGNPLFVERFEPFAVNMEIGNAYSELTDPVEQFERFTSQRLQQEGTVKGYEDHPVDMDFLHAIACGMPPTGGVGFGIDRVIMILLDQSSIRDIIPFPMSRAL
jgi:lysyl-tRNA synthetase, class II